MNVRIHVGQEGILEVREPWERLQYHPNSDLEHFLLVCRLREEVISPWAVSIWQGGECGAIVAGRIEKTVFRPRIGYGRFPGIKAMILTIIHEGILGELDDRGAEALMQAILNLLKKGGVQAVSFTALPERFTGLWSAIRQQRSRALGASKIEWTPHWVMKLEDKPGFLMERMRSNHRRRIKGNEKKLAKNYPGKLAWSWLSEFNNVSGVCEKMEIVARTTYHRGLGAGFVDSDETRQRLSLFALRGLLRVSLLEIDDEPLSFWLGIIYKGVFYPGYTGYRPDMSDYEIGTSSLLRLVDHLVEEKVERIDFGLGGAEYKERFADKSWQEANVQLFADTIKGHLLRGYLGTVSWVDQRARAMVLQMGLLKRVKNAWRARMRRKTKN